MTQHYHDDVDHDDTTATKQTRRQRPNEISSIMMILRAIRQEKANRGPDEFDSIMMMRTAS